MTASSTPPSDPDRTEASVHVTRRDRDDALAASGALGGSGSRFGAYRLVRLLGEGGMGQVYLAEQLEPVRRPVALKLIQRQLIGSLAEAYFEVERQALADMDHPAIAKVYDAGRSDQGWPWFAMEWIDGAPLDGWCEQNAANLATRIDLVEAVARGAHHAHQRGMVHRDLKPGNVLVAVVDGKPQPKIIDFGVAIGVGQAGSHVPPSYDVAGTGPYMSPEQLAGDLRAIDTRSDVYALGVILLGLLLPGGLAALGPATTTRVALHERLRGAAAGGADARDPLARIVLELRWVLVRALEPLREQRYPSAQALADELARFRSGHALEAVPASRAYRVRKFIGRHRLGFVAGAAVMLAVVGGLVTAVYGLRQAETEARKSGAIAEFLGDVLGGVDPDRARDLDKALLRAILDEAAQRARRELAAEPRVLAAVEDVIGSSYSSLGEFTPALEHAKLAYETSLATSGTDARETLDYARNYADVLTNSGAAAAGEVLARTTLERAQQVLPARDRVRLDSAVALGWAVRERGRYAEARELLEPAVEGLRAQATTAEPDPLDAGYLLSIVLSDLGQFDAAERQLRQLIETASAAFGADHPRTLRLRNSLAVNYMQSHHYAEAEPILRAVYADNLRIYGAGHSTTLGTASNLGGALRQQGKVAESGPWYLLARDGLAEKLGEKHPRAIMARHNHANFLLDDGLAEAALAQQMQANALALETFGPEHPVTAETLEGWGKAATALGRYEDAEQKLNAALALKIALHGEDSATVTETRTALAALYAAWGKPPPPP